MKNNPRNSAYTKNFNRNLLIRIIHKEPLSRAELSRKTGLTRAAITKIVDELVSEGIIIETGSAPSESGRKPILLDINPDSYYSGGLDITRESCSFGLVNIRGELISRIEIDISNASSPNKALNIIARDVSTSFKEVSADSGTFLGLGISTPGPVDVYSGKVLSPPNFRLWQNFKIVSELKKLLPWEIRLENNSTALAMAEKHYGLGKKFDNFILLVVDTGIGSGIINCGKVYRGFGGFGSEIGHTSINFNGRLCSCGNVGCLETYASIPAILDKCNKRGFKATSWQDIVNIAHSGKKQYLQIIKDEAKFLSAGIVNAINTLELEAVILTGFINYKPMLLLEKIQDYVNKHAITRDIHPVSIHISGISKNSDVIAAATIMFNFFLQEYYC